MKFYATGNGLRIPLGSRTLDDAIGEVERGGRRFCAEQTFDIENGRGEEGVAVMVDVQDLHWLEAWGDPDDEAEQYRA